MRKRMILILTALFLMTGTAGCGSNESRILEGRDIWYDALETYKNAKNYTVKSETRNADGEFESQLTAEYTGTASKITQDEDTVYYHLEDNICTGYLYDEESELWINGEIQKNDYYFYAYSLVDRLNKISAYVDRGLLVRDENTGLFTGENLPGGYFLSDSVHEPISITVEIKNGRFVSLTETYRNIKGSSGTDSSEPVVVSDGSEPPVLTDIVTIKNYQITDVRFPQNTITEDDAEEMKEFAEKLEEN